MLEIGVKKLGSMYNVSVDPIYKGTFNYWKMSNQENVKFRLKENDW